MARFRPNSRCLYCDEKLVKAPTVNRANYTCGGICYWRMNRSLNYFNPEINRRNGQSIFGLSMIWWTLRNAETPLTHHQLMSRIRSNFGDMPIFKLKLTSTAIKYFKEDCYHIEETSKGFLFSAKDVPFNAALRSKYLKVLEEVE